MQADDEPAPSRGACATLCCALCEAEPPVYAITMLPCRHAAILRDPQALATLERLLAPGPGAARGPGPGGGAVAHPRLLSMRTFEFLPASGVAVAVRRWTAQGSLRDLLRGVSPEGEHGRKYFHVGAPLSETKCCSYGYHLLQALRALAPLGAWTALHAHCANLFVDPRFDPSPPPPPAPASASASRPPRPRPEPEPEPEPDDPSISPRSPPAGRSSSR